MKFDPHFIVTGKYKQLVRPSELVRPVRAVPKQNMSPLTPPANSGNSLDTSVPPPSEYALRQLLPRQLQVRATVEVVHTEYALQPHTRVVGPGHSPFPANYLMGWLLCKLPVNITVLLA